MLIRRKLPLLAVQHQAQVMASQSPKLAVHPSAKIIERISRHVIGYLLALALAANQILNALVGLPAHIGETPGTNPARSDRDLRRVILLEDRSRVVDVK